MNTTKEVKPIITLEACQQDKHLLTNTILKLTLEGKSRSEIAKLVGKPYQLVFRYQDRCKVRLAKMASETKKAKRASKQVAEVAPTTPE